MAKRLLFVTPTSGPLSLRRTQFVIRSLWISPRRVPGHLIVQAPQRVQRVQMGLFGLGFPEIAVIAAVGIFIFGPQKIAEMGKDLGGVAGGVKKATSEFREAMEESLEEADREIELRKQQKKQGRSEKGEDIDVAAKSTSGGEGPMNRV